MAANEVAIDALSKLSGLIDQLLAATRDKTVVNSEGKEEVIQVADLKTRATVVDKITKLIQSVRKGDGGINISNISQQNNAVVIAGAGKGRSVEERIRALREKNNLRNDDDAPMIDAEPLDEDEDEDEDGYEGGEDEEGDETEYEDGGDDGESEVEREEGIGDANPPA